MIDCVAKALADFETHHICMSLETLRELQLTLGQITQSKPHETRSDAIELVAVVQELGEELGGRLQDYNRSYTWSLAHTAGQHAKETQEFLIGKRYPLKIRH